MGGHIAGPINILFGNLFIILLFCQFVTVDAFSQCSGSTVRIMTWNLLNYPNPFDINDTTTRNPCYRAVVQYVNPDVMVTQENTSANSIAFFNSILNDAGNQYSAGTFIDGYDTDNGIFFRTACFQFISNVPIHTALRDVNEFTLFHIPTGDTLRIYSCHLKASSGAANEALRAAEADSIRKVTNVLPASTDFIICGDFNTYGDFDDGYQNLIRDTATNDGNFIDPLVMTGSWNNASYAQYHTQSPHTRSFGGGATGGLDDRFDLILFSTAVSQPGGITYIQGSITPVGNDGNHYNDSINQQPNTAVPVNVADALHCASDHLPVYAEFNFVTAGVNEIAKRNISLTVFPNPSGQEVFLRCQLLHSCKIRITLYDGTGKVVKVFAPHGASQGCFEKSIARHGELKAGNYFVKVDTGDGELSSMFSIE